MTNIISRNDIRKTRDVMENNGTQGGHNLALEKTIRLEEQMNNLKEAVTDLKSTFNLFIQKSCEHSKQIVDKIEQLEDKMEDKISHQLENVSHEAEKQQKMLIDKVEHLEQKIDNLERYKWYVIGAAFALSAIASNIGILKRLIV